ncbi:alpha/beta hydrolase fold domain-containing protein [Streptomyces sp. NPDC004561]
MSAQQRTALDALLRDGPLDLGGDLTEQRELFERMLTSRPPAGDVTTTTHTLGGVPAIAVDIARRPGEQTAGVILYFHGGAYALGSAVSSVGLASDIARHARSQLLTVDYRLAPEHPHPAALQDAVAAYRGLLDAGVPAAGIALAGESAGGGLALAALVALRDADLPLPAAAALLSPWVDLTLSGASTTAKAAADPALTPGALRRRAADYAGTRDVAHGPISPLFADLTGLPPLLVQAGSHEILLDDATRLATRAAAADVAVTLDVTPGVPHVFQGFAALLDEGESALARTGAFLRTHLPAPQD